MKSVVVVAILLFMGSAKAQTVLATASEPGDVTYMAFSNQPGVGVVHPMISLKDKTACDMTDPVRMFKAEDDFGPGVWETYRRALKRIAGRQ